LLGDYASTLLLTLTNPLTILAFAAIFAGLGLGSQTPGDYRAAAILVLGVFSGSAAWWLILSSVAGLLRGRFTPRGLLWVNRISGGIIILFGMAALGSLVIQGQEAPVQAELVRGPEGRAGEAEQGAEGYARAEGPQPLRFPEDHGAHPDFQTEWWYYTGNLESGDGRHFGYQLTFFRRALLPPDDRPARASHWATNQVYLAHFTLTDVAGERFQAFERYARGAAGLAGAQSPPFRVWLRDWSVEQVEPGLYRLRAAQEGVQLDLLLADTKGPVLQGERGYSRKGPEPGNASFYISQTRLETDGTVQTPAGSSRVSGLSWMDHEFSTSALSAGQVGWDWFALQLDNGYELMVFHLRREDGQVDPFSSGTLIAPDGSTQALSRDDFTIETLARWQSPHTGADYPAGWRVSIPAAGLDLAIEPYLADQELNVSYSYWEGAVRIQGEQAGQAVSGNGYVELTGYAGSITGEF
jgi:predicted secreted hydrolase